VGGMALTAALFLVSFLQALPRAGRPGGLLRGDLKALAKLVPPPSRCRLLMNDARPLLVHRELGPTSPLPSSRRAFEAALADHQRLCVAVVGKSQWGTPGSRAPRRRHKSYRGVPLVHALVESNRLHPIVELPNLRIYEAVERARPSEATGAR
jgi:hypothetical protein